MILGSIWKGHKSYAIRFIDPIKYNVDTIKLTYLIKALMYPVCCSLLNITYLHYIYFVKKLCSFKTLDFSSNRHEINRGIKNCQIDREIVRFFKQKRRLSSLLFNSRSIELETFHCEFIIFARRVQMTRNVIERKIR